MLQCMAVMYSSDWSPHSRNRFGRGFEWWFEFCWWKWVFDRVFDNKMLAKKVGKGEELRTKKSRPLLLSAIPCNDIIACLLVRFYYEKTIKLTTHLLSLNVATFKTVLLFTYKWPKLEIWLNISHSCITSPLLCFITHMSTQSSNSRCRDQAW